MDHLALCFNLPITIHSDIRPQLKSKSVHNGLLHNKRVARTRHATVFTYSQRNHVQTVITMLDGEEMYLSEDNVCQVLDDVKSKLGSVFGNSEENRSVGITGDVEFVGLDGPEVTVRFTGRFWHRRSDVLARVSSFLKERIPEVTDVYIEDIRQLQDTEKEARRL